MSVMFLGIVLGIVLFGLLLFGLLWGLRLEAEILVSFLKGEEECDFDSSVPRRRRRKALLLPRPRGGSARSRKRRLTSMGLRMPRDER